MIRFRILIVAVAANITAMSCWAGQYEDTVVSLNPTHYFPLNEILETEAIVDLGSDPLEAVHEGMFLDSSEPIVPPLEIGEGFGQIGYLLGPNQDTDPFINKDGEPFLGFDDDNRGLFNNNSMAVNLGPGQDIADTTMTVAMFFRAPCNPNEPGQECTGAPASEGGERIFSNNFEAQDTGGTSDLDDLGHLQVDFGIGANLVVSIDNRFSDPLKSNFQVAHGDLVVKDNNWHHLVVSRNGDDLNNVILVVDGEEITQDRWVNSTDSWGVTAPFDARIGTRTTAPHPHTFNGWIDETAIWLGRQLTVAESQELYQAAMGISDDVCGDFDRDGDVDSADRTIQTTNWTGALPPGDPNANKTFEQGDCDADGDVDTADQNGTITAWTGAMNPAGNLEDSADANLIYDPATGNVKLDAGDTSSGMFISFVLGTGKNNMRPENLVESAPGNAGPFFDVGTNTDATTFQIGQTDPLNQGAGPMIDLGDIFATGIASKEALAEYLTLAEYASELGSGGTFDLTLVPEPSGLSLAVIGLLGLATRRRRR